MNEANEIRRRLAHNQWTFLICTVLWRETVQCLVEGLNSALLGKGKSNFLLNDFSYVKNEILISTLALKGKKAFFALNTLSSYVNRC